MMSLAGFGMDGTLIWQEYLTRSSQLSVYSSIATDTPYSNVPTLDLGMISG